MKYPCPHCGGEMKHQIYTLDGWCTEEEYFDCTNPECRWFALFSYGFYEEGFRIDQNAEQTTSVDEINF